MPQIRPPRTSHPRRTRARTTSPTTAASAAPPETRVRSNEDLQIDPRNANRGTPRGRALLESSLREYGAGRAVLTDRDGVLIAGNKTYEVAQRLGIPTRVIETDGQELVVVRRRDLHLASDPKARALAIADNRVGELDLDWDPAILQQLQADGLDLGLFWTTEEFERLLGEDTSDPMTLRSRRPPAQSRPTPVVLDDGHPADLARQRELFRVLRAIDVDVKRLVRYLWQRPDRALLIKERRAHMYEMQAKAGRPLFNVLINKAQRYENRLKKKGCPVPHRVDDAVYALLNALEYSVNAITDRMEGDPPSSDDRTADRYASERRRLPGLSRVHARIAPGARLPAIQQRYMPGVYRIVHRRILAALEKYSGAPLTYRGRRIVRTWESEAAAAPSADILTAAFVRLVYPLWGASTTATKVRTARSRP